MIPFNRKPLRTVQQAAKEVHIFNMSESENVDLKTVASFGEEWKKFNRFDEAEIQKIGDDYFDILPETVTNRDAVVLDAGCGSGRWAVYLAPRVQFIECIDPSMAVYTAANVLAPFDNTRISQVD